MVYVNKLATTKNKSSLPSPFTFQVPSGAGKKRTVSVSLWKNHISLIEGFFFTNTKSFNKNEFKSSTALCVEKRLSTVISSCLVHLSKHDLSFCLDELKVTALTTGQMLHCYFNSIDALYSKMTRECVQNK